MTDDHTEAWWWKAHGKTIGPRQELVAEMHYRAGCALHAPAKPLLRACQTALAPRRFPANRIPALHFHALLNEEAFEVELALA